jgi:hypothetical protein
MLADHMTTELVSFVRGKSSLHIVKKVQQQFGYHDPQLVIRLLSIYSNAMYGSPYGSYILKSIRSSTSLGTQQSRRFFIHPYNSYLFY